MNRRGRSPFQAALYSLSRASNSLGDRARLYVYTREVEVLVCVSIAIAGKLKDTQVPVSPIGRG